MAKENAKKFDQLLVSDENLQAKIRAAMDAYTGDRRDEQAVFEAVIRPLAEEAGLPFTFEDAKACVEEEGEISLEEGTPLPAEKARAFSSAPWTSRKSVTVRLIRITSSWAARRARMSASGLLTGIKGP